MNDIAAEVRDIIVLHLGVAEAQITDDASFKDTLGADSLDLVEIVMTCEERFDIIVFAETIEHLIAPPDLVLPPPLLTLLLLPLPLMLACPWICQRPLRTPLTSSLTSAAVST